MIKQEEHSSNDEMWREIMKDSGRFRIFQPVPERHGVGSRTNPDLARQLLFLWTSHLSVVAGRE
jgi:hypothetical protein